MTPDGEPGLHYLCQGYKAFFTHIDDPMKMMAGLVRSGREAVEILIGTAGVTRPGRATTRAAVGVDER